MPVLVSPVVVMAGAAAEPAEKVATPVALSVVNAPVEGVVAPTVPLIGPAKPVEVSIVPLKVKFAESVSRPLVVEYTTRPDVRPELMMLVAESWGTDTTVLAASTFTDRPAG
jgi:hypothetical protein